MLLTDDGVRPLDPTPGPGVLLGDGDRTPLLAVGSNASPAQLWHKFRAAGVPSVVPMVPVAVTGLASGMAAYVARAGYVPATPVLGPDLTAELFVLWLDADQLARLDATEPNYRRVPLALGDPAAGSVRVTLPSGRPLDRCDVYAGVHGHLVLGDGADPLLLDDQATLLARLLAASTRLRRLAGETAQEWVERTRLPGVADEVRATFRDEGWVRPWVDGL